VRVSLEVSIALAIRLDMREVAAAGPVTAAPDEGRTGSPATPAAAIDSALVARYRAGDRSAFDEIVRRYQKPIYYVALRYLKVEADAADITQRTFVKVYGAIGRFRAESTFRTWIYRIAINLCLNQLRDRRREELRGPRDEEVAAEPGEEVSFDAELTAQERGERLRAAIAELPPKQRMVLELRIYDELPFREVAELVGSSENAAKVNFHHAVKRLRGLMGGER
jgi:RNA polymerase sigma-70 factor (ECF subfamily)